MDVERLVTWALRDQGLGWSGGGDRLGFADYGTVIDASPVAGLPSPALWTDDDALVVRQAIDALPAAARTLVVQYGRAGLRPDASDPDPELQPLVDRRGRQMWEHERPGDRKSRKMRPLMDWAGHSAALELVAFSRAQYRLWWQALADLVRPLNAAMKSHVALPPGAPREPWRGAAIVHGLGAAAVERAAGVRAVADEAGRHALTLGERRAAAQAPVRARPGDATVPAVPIERTLSRPAREAYRRAAARASGAKAAARAKPA